MPDERMSYREVLTRAAERLEGLPAEYERLGYSGVYARGTAAQVPPALRAAAKLMEEAERIDGNGDLDASLVLLSTLAAGYDPQEETDA